MRVYVSLSSRTDSSPTEFLCESPSLKPIRCKSRLCSQNALRVDH
jgi:hypothetical protein